MKQLRSWTSRPPQLAKLNPFECHHVEVPSDRTLLWRKVHAMCPNLARQSDSASAMIVSSSDSCTQKDDNDNISRCSNMSLFAKDSDDEGDDEEIDVESKGDNALFYPCWSQDDKLMFSATKLVFCQSAEQQSHVDKGGPCNDKSWSPFDKVHRWNSCHVQDGSTCLDIPHATIRILRQNVWRCLQEASKKPRIGSQRQKSFVHATKEERWHPNKFRWQD